MQQTSLFNTLDFLTGLAIPVKYYPTFLTPQDADKLFAYCQQKLAWRQNQIRMIGKDIPLPRLECMYGEEGFEYTYSSSVHLKALPWTNELSTLKRQIEGITGHKFQIVVGNFYRDGRDYIGWHSDNEASMGKSPAIASLSLGEARKFQIRLKPKGEIHNIWLEHGSLLLMQPGFQEDWLHQLPKSNQTGVRINLTFRPYATQNSAS
ncbi:MAG: alpha-ketoglutarate-dependent dioxygenase AlkB [Brasilonema octagenarum HA4186-MV1]|jgi:alkylated DNA repair dioxygenase AlkB|nr:alpha-ketoglutarate-dependent dioxygenase AlkB [Brasilonema octagenarum HA4186-MV1]